MKTVMLLAFLTAIGFAAVPTNASAMPTSPQPAAGSGVVEQIDTGCARGYYRSYNRCIPYSHRPRTYYAPRYYAPRYYAPPPTYYYRPYRPYYRPHYYYRPYY